jgi:hypothetical protein
MKKPGSFSAPGAQIHVRIGRYHVDSKASIRICSLQPAPIDFLLINFPKFDGKNQHPTRRVAPIAVLREVLAVAA